jgi:hypothetical protein
MLIQRVCKLCRLCSHNKIDIGGNLKTKWNLTKSEQRAHSANSARLESAGVAIGVENAVSSDSPILTIEQRGDGVICAGTRAGIELAVFVRLNPLKSGIAICTGEIIVPGCDDVTIFLVEPPGCKMFGWLGLRKDTVLNHIIFSGRPLPRGVNLEGFVVAQSFHALASQFQPGMKIGARICLYDQFDNLCSSVVELNVERHPQRFRARKGNGLFGPEDGIVPVPTHVRAEGTGRPN